MNGWRVEFHLGMTFVEDHAWTDAPQPDGTEQIVRLNPGPGLGLTPDKDFLRDTRATRT
jgi:hypothetical protein